MRNLHREIGPGVGRGQTRHHVDHRSHYVVGIGVQGETSAEDSLLSIREGVQEEW